MATLIDRFELAFPVTELPLPAIERYRLVPMTSLYLEVDYEDADQTDETGFYVAERAAARSSVSSSPDSERAPQSDRYLRARCWASEE